MVPVRRHCTIHEPASRRGERGRRLTSVPISTSARMSIGTTTKNPASSAVVDRPCRELAGFWVRATVGTFVFRCGRADPKPAARSFATVVDVVEVLDGDVVDELVETAEPR